MAAVVCKPLFFFCLSQAVRKKSAANRRKHGVSFAEAKTAFKKHYDFSKSVRNPYLSKAKKQLPIRVDEDTIAYFKSLAEKNGVSARMRRVREDTRDEVGLAASKPMLLTR